MVDTFCLLYFFSVFEDDNLCTFFFRHSFLTEFWVLVRTWGIDQGLVRQGPSGQLETWPHLLWRKIEESWKIKTLSFETTENINQMTQICALHSFWVFWALWMGGGGLQNSTVYQKLVFQRKTLTYQAFLSTTLKLLFVTCL